MTTKTVSSREHRTVSLCSNRRGVSPLQLSSTLLAMSLLALPTVVNAQTAAAPSTAAATAAETIRLTPFEVSEAVDDSFNTSTVGTGGRLVLDLKEVPAQYSVINRAFIDALGITDINEAAGWAPGQSFNEGNTLGDTDGQYGRFQQRGFTQLTTPNSTNSSGSSTGAQRNFFQNSAAGNQDAYAVNTPDRDPEETAEWLESLDALTKVHGRDRARDHGVPPRIRLPLRIRWLRERREQPARRGLRWELAHGRCARGRERRTHLDRR